jgi:hypothetical protein
MVGDQSFERVFIEKLKSSLLKSGLDASQLRKSEVSFADEIVYQLGELYISIYPETQDIQFWWGTTEKMQNGLPGLKGYMSYELTAFYGDSERQFSEFFKAFLLYLAEPKRRQSILERLFSFLR